jgi:hypothetical protein
VKRCFKCGTEKPLSEFYKHPAMADGRLGKCKDCTKLDVRLDRQANPRVREYDRQRAAAPHRKKLAASVLRSWRAEHPDRQQAHNAAARARLQPPDCCEGCGLPLRLEKHHPDYSKPLIVVWLCKPCHAIADKIRRRLEAS